jgi:membrane protease YdiL (CAAX protease family)
MIAFEPPVATHVRTPIVALPVAAGGVSLLLARPWLVSAGAGAAGLALLYLAVGAMALTVPHARLIDPGGSIRSRALSPVHPGVALIIGVGAFVVARMAQVPVAPLSAAASAIALDVMAAVAEEAFFRRFLYSALLPFGAALAIVLSGLAFAFVHVPLYGGAVFWVDLGAGLLLGWQRWASGSWTVTAATHVAANILAVLR